MPRHRRFVAPLSGSACLKRVALALLAALLLFSLIGAESAHAATTKPTRYNPDHPEILDNAFLFGEIGVVIEQHSGKVLYDMRGDKKAQPASTTKVMTLLLALENGKLDDVVTVGAEIRDVPGDSTKVPLLVGEEITLEELLYGLIIPSGNDAAMTIAKHISGSVEAFVDLMNRRAQELGCTGTHFANPHGYEDKDHYTTAIDMALIAREGMKDERFRKIVGTPSFTIAKNNMRSSDKTLTTKNQFVGRSSSMKYIYEYGTGIKTGYFSSAKHTFVASATKDGIDLIAVVMRTTQVGKWEDAKRLMEYGFAVCEAYSVQELYASSPLELQVEGASPEDENEGTLIAELAPDDEGFTFAALRESVEAMREDFSRYYAFEGEELRAPIAKGDEIGTLVFQPEDGDFVRYALIAGRDVAAVPSPTDVPVPEALPSAASAATSLPGDVSPTDAPPAAPFPLEKVLPAAIICLGALLLALILWMILRRSRRARRLRHRAYPPGRHRYIPGQAPAKAETPAIEDISAKAEPPAQEAEEEAPAGADDPEA